jgi:myo-inositol-1-phosphate synthase
MSHSPGLSETSTASAEPGAPGRPSQGRLGVLLPGMGAVASTFVAGVVAARQGLAAPVGSLALMGHLPDRHGQPGDRISDAVPLVGLDDLVFGGWDPLSANLLDAASTADVLDREHLASVSKDLEGVVAMDAVFDQRWVSRIEGHRVKAPGTKWDHALALIDDIERFRSENDCDRLVMIWCGSTEAYHEPTEVHASIEAFEEGLKQDHQDIAPSQIYAYAALVSGVPYANGAPNLTVDLPCMVELAEQQGVPMAGKDFKTGQTLMKTILAPGLRTRMLGLRGWYSTNILGNRDGEVLDDPANFRSKEHSKLGVLDTILEPERHPELYGNIDHVVRINYYPPRGDNKEGWDAIDVFGWMGYPMEIKVNFSCRDSILAAPLVLDLVLFLDLAARAGSRGVQDWLSFYFKAPQEAAGQGDAAAPKVEHDIFVQQATLLDTLTSLTDRLTATSTTGA